MSEAGLRFVAAFATPAERVFAVLTEARHLERWFCDACECEPRPGGRLVLRWSRAGSSAEPFEARWLEFAPPLSAAFQGGHAGYPNGNAGTVWFALDREGAGTNLELRHDFPSDGEYVSQRQAWSEAWPRALARLSGYLSTSRSTAVLSAPPRFERYVALGDSSTEGLMDVDGRGGYRGWSQRLAERITAAQGGLLYANLAVRGRTTREIREQQLERALALRPDLATLFSGTNDVMQARFDVAAFASDVREMQRALRGAGATLVTFTLPDLSPLLLVARPFAARIRVMNDAVRDACRATGSHCVDFAAHPVAIDPRLWNEDRIHANPDGHARIADALAQALGLPGSNGDWKTALPPEPTPSPLAEAVRELAWMLRYLLPWTMQALLAPRSRDLRPGKRPQLAPVVSPDA